MVYNFCLSPLIEGLGIGAALIIAIGAQNAFVLKQGISQNHVLATVLICAFIDTLLIIVGISGLGQILTSNIFLLHFARWGGVVFLTYYGFRSFRAAFKTQSLEIHLGKSPLPNLKETITTALALSLLNPHVFLDTVVLLGSIGAQFSPLERPFFALGAIVASFIWFFCMGFGARYLRPFFQKPISWKILDCLIGCIMWAIALSLILGMKRGC